MGTAVPGCFSLYALRYYENIGLLADVERNPAGQRRFSNEHLDWLSVVRCLPETGMPIAEVVQDAENWSCRETTWYRRLSNCSRRTNAGRPHTTTEQISVLRDEQRYIHRKVAYYRRTGTMRSTTACKSG